MELAFEISNSRALKKRKSYCSTRFRAIPIFELHVCRDISEFQPFHKNLELPKMSTHRNSKKPSEIVFREFQ